MSRPGAVALRPVLPGILPFLRPHRALELRLLCRAANLLLTGDPVTSKFWEYYISQRYEPGFSVTSLGGHPSRIFINLAATHKRWRTRKFLQEWRHACLPFRDALPETSTNAALLSARPQEDGHHAELGRRRKAAMRGQATAGDVPFVAAEVAGGKVAVMHPAASSDGALLVVAPSLACLRPSATSPLSVRGVNPLFCWSQTACTPERAEPISARLLVSHPPVGMDTPDGKLAVHCRVSLTAVAEDESGRLFQRALGVFCFPLHEPLARGSGTQPGVWISAMAGVTTTTPGGGDRTYVVVGTNEGRVWWSYLDEGAMLMTEVASPIDVEAGSPVGRLQVEISSGELRRVLVWWNSLNRLEVWRRRGGAGAVFDPQFRCVMDLHSPAFDWSYCPAQREVALLNCAGSPGVVLIKLDRRSEDPGPVRLGQTVFQTERLPTDDPSPKPWYCFVRLAQAPQMALSLREAGGWLIVVDKYLRVIEWSSDGVKTSSTLTGHAAPIYAAQFDGFRRAVTVDESEFLIIWDVRTRHKVCDINLLEDPTSSNPQKLEDEEKMVHKVPAPCSHGYVETYASPLPLSAVASEAPLELDKKAYPALANTPSTIGPPTPWHRRRPVLPTPKPVESNLTPAAQRSDLREEVRRMANALGVTCDELQLAHEQMVESTAQDHGNLSTGFLWQLAREDGMDPAAWMRLQTTPGVPTTRRRQQTPAQQPMITVLGEAVASPEELGGPSVRKLRRAVKALIFEDDTLGLYFGVLRTWQLWSFRSTIGRTAEIRRLSQPT